MDNRNRLNEMDDQDLEKVIGGGTTCNFSPSIKNTNQHQDLVNNYKNDIIINEHIVQNNNNNQLLINKENQI